MPRVAEGLAETLARQALRDLQGLPARLALRLAGGDRLAAAASIAELRLAARAALPRAIFDFVDGGADDEVTLAANESDFDRLRLAPRVGVDVASIDTTVEILGLRLGLPLLGAPTGLTGLVHPQGEAAVARALHGAGSLYCLSAMGSYSLEELAALAPGPRWFQLYVWRDRGAVAELLERAREAGYAALVVAVDTPCLGRRRRDQRNGFGIPPRLTPRSFLDGVRHPRWSAAFLREARVRPANAPGGGERDVVALSEFVGRQFDPSLSWQELAGLREQWAGPLVVKGLLRGDDARRAAELGADAVVVSNHGGRQLDQALSTIAALPAVVEALGGQVPVLLDGGIRRGTDVLKALALGARACLLGRPLLYGLAAGGEAGVGRALELLRLELELALALTGCPSLGALDASLVVGAARLRRRPRHRCGGNAGARRLARAGRCARRCPRRALAARRGEVGDDRRVGVEDVPVGAEEAVDRPVGAEEAPLDAEGLDAGEHPGAQRVDRPAAVVHAEARDLADGVGGAGHRLEPRLQSRK